MSMISRRGVVKASVAVAVAMALRPTLSYAFPHGGGGTSSALVFLASGHYIPKIFPLALNYPQPNASVSSYARHLWAYWDGTNAVEYRVPVGVQFGAPPYVFELLAGPPGMTIPQPNWIPGYTPAQMLALGYGDVVWTPQGNISSSGSWTVTVRMYSQDYQTDNTQYIDVTWVVTTSSSTAQFVFVDPVSGNDSNAGTISAPKLTVNSLFQGTSVTTFPGAVCYLRTGTHSLTAALSVDSAYTPFAVVGFPGESPVIDITNGGANVAVGFTGTIADFFAQNIEFTGSATASTGNYQYFELSQNHTRNCFHNLSFPNVFSGATAANNSTCVYALDTGRIGSYNQYFYMKGCSETNRVGNGQSYGLYCLYGVEYHLGEFCTITGTNGPDNMYPKASDYNGERRFNWVELASGNTSWALAVGAQNNPDGISGNDIIWYNWIIAQGGDAVRLNAAANFNFGASCTLENGSTTLTITQTGFSGTATLVSGYTTLTVASVTSGLLGKGMNVSGTDIPSGNTYIVQQLSGTPGAAGTYEMSAAATATVSTPESITASSNSLTAGMTVEATGIPSGTTIMSQLSGTTQGVGTYEMRAAATSTVSTPETVFGTGFLTACYVYRNSMSGDGFAFWSDLNPGPYAFEKNAIQYGSFPAGVTFALTTGGGVSGPPYPSNVSDPDTSAEASTGVFDANWNLTGSFATYAGTHGAQIQ
jgi:hypothetical protein